MKIRNLFTPIYDALDTVVLVTLGGIMGMLLSVVAYAVYDSLL